MENNLKKLRKYVAFLASFPCIIMVPIAQLINVMRNPVPKQEIEKIQNTTKL